MSGETREKSDSDTELHATVDDATATTATSTLAQPDTDETKHKHKHKDKKDKDKDKDKEKEKHKHKHHKSSQDIPMKVVRSSSGKGHKAASPKAAARSALFEESAGAGGSGRQKRGLSKSSSIASLLSSRRRGEEAESPKPLSPVLHHTPEGAAGEALLEDTPEQDGERVGPDSAHKLKKKKEFQVNAVGEVVYKKHPSWVLMHQMQIGIYHSLCYTVPRMVEQGISKGLLKRRSDSATQEEQYITDEAFYETPKILRFPSEGSMMYSTPPHKLGDFKFKDYCPLVFRWVRAFFGITSPLDFLGSLCGYHVNKIDGSASSEEEGNPLRLMGTPGKSGSLFFFTQDMKYCIKTIPKHEAKLLRHILKPYVKHLQENPNTLLPRFFGLYRVKPHHGSQVRFVVMSNLFSTNLLIHERFDLKGSDVGRYTSLAERKKKGRLATLKEHNWKEMKRSILFPSPPSAAMSSDTCSKALFMEQLRRDTQFLAEQDLMDYSLLVGLHFHDADTADTAGAADGTGTAAPAKRTGRARAASDAAATPALRVAVGDPSANTLSRSQPECAGSVPTSPTLAEPAITPDMLRALKDKPTARTTVHTSSMKNSLAAQAASGAAAAAAASAAAAAASAAAAAAPTTPPPPPPEKEDKNDEDDDEEDEEEKEEEEEESSEGSSKQHEFLSMKMNLQPHTTQVEQCYIDGIGDVEVVTMPLNDYSIPAEDAWPEHGTPFVRYRNLWYKDHGGMYSGINRISYFFGIIDILMLYTPRKGLERTYKTIRYHGQGEVSSCPPSRYAIRFLSFINASSL